jgi:uncharacterized protein YjiS (DUF1127 family)
MRSAQCCAAAFALLLTVPADYLPFRKQEILPCSERVNAMLLSHLVGVYRQWRRYNDSLRELNQLGDRELADIGISRGDIPRVAWETSED